MSDQPGSNQAEGSHASEIGGPLDRPELTTNGSSDVKDGISTAPPQIGGEAVDTATQADSVGESQWGPDKATTIAKAIQHEYIPNPDPNGLSLDTYRDLEYKSSAGSAEKVIEEQSRLPEELYDTNPELYAEMTTKRFLSVLREFRVVDKAVTDVEQEIEAYEERKQACEEALRAGKLSWRNFKQDFDEFSWDDPRQKLLSLSLDTPPRKTLEEVRDQFDKQIGDLAKKLEKAKADRRAFLENQGSRKR